MLIWAAVLVGACPVLRAQGAPAERALLALANGDRMARGLPSLRWNEALARAAGRHAMWMAAQGGELEHVYRGEPELVQRASREGAHFASIAENLGRGARDPAEMEMAWMRSAPHRANLLDREMTDVGIAVMERGGVLYAVEDFARAVPAPQREEIEAQVAAEIQRAGMPAVPGSQAARSVCAGAPASGARMEVQWDGPDPGKLPETLLRQIGMGVYRNAAVGACPSREPGRGFTAYRVAVLLF